MHTESRRKCARCPEDDPMVVRERHHRFGRNNSPETIWLCLNCHKKITELQNLLPPKVRSKSASNHDKRRMEDVSIAGDLELLSQRLKNRAVDENENSS